MDINICHIVISLKFWNSYTRRRKSTPAIKEGSVGADCQGWGGVGRQGGLGGNGQGGGAIVGQGGCVVDGQGGGASRARDVRLS